MSAPTLGKNNWDVLYSILPDFYRINQSFTAPKVAASSVVGLALTGISFYLNSEKANLASKVIFWTGLACLSAKPMTMLAERIWYKIFDRSNESILMHLNLETWGGVMPPRNPRTTLEAQSYGQSLTNLWNSFPGRRDILLRPIGAPAPIPKPYSRAQLEAECGKFMESSLQIASGVIDDLKVWSQQRTFPLKGVDLLTAQPGLHPFSSSWLYKGFFFLPRAYRMIFNLDECESLFKEGPSRVDQAEIDQFTKSYPAQNREILKDWKPLFFQPGTIQYAWREKYNALMREIYDLVGGAAKIPDDRFANWGALHQERDLEFRRNMGTAPT